MVISDAWLDIHWPPYWHYDVLQGLRAVASVDMASRKEAVDGVAWLQARRRSDGTWATSGRRWWKRPGSTGGGVEVVDWAALASPVVTAQAAAVLTSLANGGA